MDKESLTQRKQDLMIDSKSFVAIQTMFVSFVAQNVGLCVA
jgi:hypothetical protein